MWTNKETHGNFACIRHHIFINREFICFFFTFSSMYLRNFFKDQKMYYVLCIFGFLAGACCQIIVFHNSFGLVSFHWRSSLRYKLVLSQSSPSRLFPPSTTTMSVHSNLQQISCLAPPLTDGVFDNPKWNLNFHALPWQTTPFVSELQRTNLKLQFKWEFDHAKCVKLAFSTCRVVINAWQSSFISNLEIYVYKFMGESRELIAETSHIHSGVL